MMNSRWVTNDKAAAVHNANFLSYWINLLFKTVMDFEFGCFKTFTFFGKIVRNPVAI